MKHMIPSFIKKANINKKLEVILPFFKDKEKVLDFGCGDMALEQALKNKNPLLSITGVDVVDFGLRPSGVKFVRYDGVKLPFKSNSFDSVLSFYVLHHCESAKRSLAECLRVARKRVIVVESIARHPMELPFMKFVDWLFNLLKKERSAFANQFLTQKQWVELIKKLDVKVKVQKEINVMPQSTFLPLGRSYLIVFYKDKTWRLREEKSDQNSQTGWAQDRKT